jgi:hypothetical protein
MVADSKQSVSSQLAVSSQQWIAVVVDVCQLVSEVKLLLLAVTVINFINKPFKLKSRVVLSC